MMMEMMIKNMLMVIILMIVQIKMTGGNPDVRSDKILTLLTFDI